jgi:hypothetical protein
VTLKSTFQLVGGVVNIVDVDIIVMRTDRESLVVWRIFQYFNPLLCSLVRKYLAVKILYYIFYTAVVLMLSAPSLSPNAR